MKKRIISLLVLVCLISLTFASFTYAYAGDQQSVSISKGATSVKSKIISNCSSKLYCKITVSSKSSENVKLSVKYTKNGNTGTLKTLTAAPGKTKELTFDLGTTYDACWIVLSCNGNGIATGKLVD
jgi:hypothetical protein